MSPRSSAHPRFLLDINVLLALVDPAHVHHTLADRWFSKAEAWATCAITENGFVRILSNPAYPGVHLRPVEAAALLSAFTRVRKHAFFHDVVTLRDRRRFYLEKVAPAQLTDVYLLGLAVAAGGVLATFDTRIPTGAVEGGPAALEIIGG